MGIVNLIKPLFNNQPRILFIHISSIGVKRLELMTKMNHPSMNSIRYDLNLYVRQVIIIIRTYAVERSMHSSRHTPCAVTGAHYTSKTDGSIEARVTAYAYRHFVVKFEYS